MRYPLGMLHNPALLNAAHVLLTDGPDSVADVSCNSLKILTVRYLDLYLQCSANIIHKSMSSLRRTLLIIGPIAINIRDLRFMHQKYEWHN